ncbi:MAG TPA: NAD(P)-dependent oxidoreductase, partial [Vicinamibacterales bacterium]|nr:NAD(P)-dependent oxidoreductase [Vicinamibacterales bacterium]
MDQVLGFVGVGRMGGPMANRLLDAGHSLCVFDTSAEAVKPLAARGAKVASSAEDVASSADMVLISLPTPPIVQAVSLGSILKGNRLKTLVDLSTTGPTVAGIVAKAASERGVAWVDSPVSGGIGGATKGTLAVMVSCKKDAFPVVDPVLKTFGKTFYVGEKPGLAQIAKLANNLLAAAAIVLSSEAIAMGVKAGLDAKTLCDIINAGSGRNSATQDKFPKSIIPRTFDFGFATGLSYKDVRLCLDEAEALGV